jgi:hypothetical protein
MTEKFYVALALLAAFSFWGAFRAQRTGAILLLWVPAMVLRIGWSLLLAGYLFAWLASYPLPSYYFVAFCTQTALFLPWWCGLRAEGWLRRRANFH